MSNQMQQGNNQNPMAQYGARPNYMQQSSGNNSKLLAGIGGGRGDIPTLARLGNMFVVKIGGNSQPLKDQQGNPVTFLPIAIVDVLEHDARIMYDPNKRYDPNAVEAPLCTSYNGSKPDADSQIPQSPLCATCQWAVRGSNPKNPKTSQCQSGKAMVVKILGMDYLFAFRITPNDFSEWRTLVGTELKAMNADINQIILVVQFNPEVKQGTGYKFKVGGWLPQHEYEYVLNAYNNRRDEINHLLAQDIGPTHAFDSNEQVHDSGVNTVTPNSAANFVPEPVQQQGPQTLTPAVQQAYAEYQPQQQQYQQPNTGFTPPVINNPNPVQSQQQNNIVPPNFSPAAPVQQGNGSNGSPPVFNLGHNPGSSTGSSTPNLNDLQNIINSVKSTVNQG